MRARTYRALFLSVLVALGLSLCALVPYALAAEPALPVAQAAESGSTPSGTASAADQAEPSSAERGDPDDPVYQFAFNLGYALAYVLVVLFLVIPPLAIAVAVYALVSKRRMAKRVPPVMMPPAAAPPQVGPPLAGPYAGGGVPVEAPRKEVPPQAELVKFSDEYVEQLARKYESADAESGVPQ